MIRFWISTNNPEIVRKAGEGQWKNIKDTHTVIETDESGKPLSSEPQPEKKSETVSDAGEDKPKTRKRRTKKAD